MKNHITMIATAAAVLAATFLPAATAAGASANGPRTTAPAQQLNGSWLTTITLQNPPPGIDASFRGLDTFIPSGSLVVSSSQASPTLRSLAHGTWVRTGNRRFLCTFVWFRFSPAGLFIGMQKVRRTMTTNAANTTFQATDTITLLGPDGTTVLATGQGTETGTRLTTD
jgi:hypothetical protein